MTLAQMESRFFELKGKLSVGQLTEDEFKREIEKLRFQDHQGRWWMIGAQSGRWYYYDGARWLLGQPPEPAAPPPPPPPVKPETRTVTPPADKPKKAADVTPAVPPRAAPSTPPPPAASSTTQPMPRYAPAPQRPVAKPVTPAPTPAASEPPRPKPVVGVAPRPRDPSVHTPTLADRVRDEMSHMHMPDVHMPPVHAPQVHVPEVHAPAPIRRFSPNIILIGAVVAGLLLVALMWVAVDNLIPGKPITSVWVRAFGVSVSATPSAQTTPLAPGADNVDNFLRVGDELAAQSQFAPALTQYQNAARAAPNRADVYVHWARALALTGRIQDAVNTIQRATRLDANSADAYAELTRALAWSGQNDKAITAGEKAVQLDAKAAAAHAFLAEAYLRAGRTDDAQKEASSAVKLDDQNADAHRALGWVDVLAGQKDPALGEWQKVVQLAPNIFFYHYEFGEVYGTYLNDPASAVPEYQKAIDLFPPYVPSYIALGQAYIDQNQPGAAILQYQKALTFDSNSNDAYVGLGFAFQKQGRCEQAIPYFQKSLALNPNGNDALRGLGDCNALAQGQSAPAATAVSTPELVAVPTAIVQATVVPLAGATSIPGNTASTGKATAVPGVSPAGAKSSGRIAFAVYDGQYHLYLANLDGSNRTRLLDPAASDPVFSPDGSQLLYYSWQSDQRGIHRIEADGTADQQISLRSEDFLPSWAPDGTRYIYDTRAGQGSDITKRAYRLRIDDPTAKANQDPPDFVQGQYPAWGPNNKIVFRNCGFPTDSCGLALISADGGTPVALVPNMNATGPAWSPDGKLIAFMSDYGGNWDIYIISASGGSPSRLTTDPAEDGLPTFSPDGKQIAYLAHRNGTWSIWAMGIDGSNQHKLFDLGGDPAGPVPGSSGGQPGQVWYEQRISWH